MKINGLIPRLYNPPVFQGRKKSSNYFEGWYFKLVDGEGNHIWSVIPGVSYSDDTHSFVQVIHANSSKTYYLRYSREAFTYSGDKFGVSVGPNHFSDQGISLDISHPEISLRGELSFSRVQTFPVKLLSPGIMGWYAFVPFLECYHGVVSMQHELSGSLKVNGFSVIFDGGRGYIEKDWGKSMPSDWIWMQSNHFELDQQASFMVSLARIPWLKGYFPGFLSFLLLNGEVYRFATYNRSVVHSLEVTDDHVKVILKNRKFLLEVKAMRRDGGVLKAPRHGSMEREIKESIISVIYLELKNSVGEVLYSDKGRFAGLEIVGDMKQYY